MEKISLITSDKIKLSALLWNQQAIKSVLLLHMMPATKESWQNLAEKLVAQDFNVLAIDFRGHGESEGGDYKTFIPEQHQKYYIDIETAVDFLRQRYPQTEISMGGASIGAMMTIKYLAEHHEVSKGVSLSAGLDYIGIRPIDYVKNLSPNQRLLFVGSYDDLRGGPLDFGHMAQQLYDLAICQKGKIIYQTGGHGTDLFNAHPELIEEIVNFLQS